MSPIIKVESISKQYRLGVIGTGTLSHDINRWWHRVRGREDPYLKIGVPNIRNKKESSDYVWALKDINFEVKPGEILGIIGKNGAGKSTLLKLLSRVTAPTTGKITAHGRIASLLEVGTGFHPELTGRENIFLNGAILGMTKKEIKSKFDEIVDFAGCTNYIETPVKRYSSGMYVRLAFSVAAHLEPDILVVDEVLAVGDAEFQKKAIGKMKSVSENSGRTVLFVSHNMASIQNLCTKVFVLEDGTTAFSGDTADGIDFYMKSNVEEIKVNLTNQKKRGGKGGLRFSKIVVKNVNLLPITEIFSGMTTHFEIEIEINHTVEKPLFRIMFLDLNGIIRFLCNNYFSMNEEIVLPSYGTKIIRCTIPDFPLPKGEYIVQLTCFSNEGIQDDIESAAKISVAGGDFFNTGKEQILKEGVLVKNYYELL